MPEDAQRPAEPFISNTATDPGPVFKPLKYRKTGPHSVEIVSDDPPERDRPAEHVSTDADISLEASQTEAASHSPLREQGQKKGVDRLDELGEAFRESPLVAFAMGNIPPASAAEPEDDPDYTWACPSCSSKHWKWQCGTMCSECGTLSTARQLRADSHSTQRHTAAHGEQQANGIPVTAMAELDKEMGNVPPSPASGGPAGDDEPPAREEPLSVLFKRRMESEGRWKEVSLVRDRMMVEAKKAIPDKESRRAWVYAELDRMYPPIQQNHHGARTYGDETDMVLTPNSISSPSSQVSGVDSGAIQWLTDLPEGWPALPANASLSVELAWVQANRLFMVEERPGKATRVRLDRAASPAPSRAALGWLETSIRSYAKFLDAAVKVGGGEDDGESAVMKRERKAVDEVRALLLEMEEAAGVCPSCGQTFASQR